MQALILGHNTMLSSHAQAPSGKLHLFCFFKIISHFDTFILKVPLKGPASYPFSIIYLFIYLISDSQEQLCTISYQKLP